MQCPKLGIFQGFFPFLQSSLTKHCVCKAALQLKTRRNTEGVSFRIPRWQFIITWIKNLFLPLPDNRRIGNFMALRIDKLYRSFLKGMYIYRKIPRQCLLIPKGLYVKYSKLHTIPSGLRTNHSFSINIYSLREFRTSLFCDMKPIIP